MNELTVGSGHEVSLSIVTLMANVDGRTNLPGTLKEGVENMLETGAFPRKGQWRNLWSPLTEYFKRQLEGSGKAASLSVAALIGDPLSGDLEGYRKEG